MLDTDAATGARATGSRFPSLPSTSVGWWAGGLLIAWIVWLVLRSRLSSQVFSPMIGGHRTAGTLLDAVTPLLAIVAAVVALVALVYYRERSWVVWLALLPGVLVLFVLVAFGLGGG